MTTATEFADQLKQLLGQPLPGASAMRAWAPQLAYGRHFVPPPPSARQSAVVVLLYPGEDDWYVPLTLRPATLSHHASQISLPGGALDAGESPEDGAWRELQEELGIARDSFEPLGRLTPLYIFASNFFVTPCVAVGHAIPQFRPNPAEVQTVLEMPLATLLGGEAHCGLLIERGNLSFRAPCWQLGSHQVWGASAMMLGELAAVLRDVRRQ